MPKQYTGDAIECWLVNFLGIVVAKFPVSVDLTATRFFMYQGKVYERKFEAGGVAPAFYEIQPFILGQQDVLNKGHRS
jgi:hypothetical protein